MEPQELDSSARTVVDVAAHIRRLRQRATDFHEGFETGNRGYFSPTEDDAVLSLWVSYHNGRNALFELIESIRADVGSASEDSIAEFIVAYGAAVVLVDAARFLRDLFGEDAIVRRKLNESVDAFGIPAGSFDAVQMSLTNPTNALAINGANAFYDTHAEAITAAAAESQSLGRIVETIEALRNRASVTKRRFAKVRLDDRRRQLRDAVVRDGVLRVIYALQELGSRFMSSLSTMPRHQPRLPVLIADQLEAALLPGDVFVTRKDSAVTNYFLPGYWPHAAMYVGDGLVVEALKDGVQERTLESPFGNDAVAVIRPRLTEQQIQEGIARARTHVGKPYDFDFDFTRADRMVCTEVVYRSYEGIGGTGFKLSKRAGRQTLAAEDLLSMALREDSFGPLVVYCQPHSTTLLRDQQAAEVLRRTMSIPNDFA